RAYAGPEPAAEEGPGGEMGSRWRWFGAGVGAAMAAGSLAYGADLRRRRQPVVNVVRLSGVVVASGGSAVLARPGRISHEAQEARLERVRAHGRRNSLALLLGWLEVADGAVAHARPPAGV